MCNILKEVHNNSIFLWKQELAKEIEDPRNCLVPWKGDGASSTNRLLRGEGVERAQREARDLPVFSNSQNH